MDVEVERNYMLIMFKLWMYFLLSVDSKAIDYNAKIDDVTMQGLKDLGLFGQQIPQQYGKDDISNFQLI